MRARRALYRNLNPAETCYARDRAIQEST